MMRLSKRLLLSLAFAFSVLLASVVLPGSRSVQALNAANHVLILSPGYDFCNNTLSLPVDVAFTSSTGNYWTPTVYVGGVPIYGVHSFGSFGRFYFTSANAVWFPMGVGSNSGGGPNPFSLPPNTIVTVTFYMAQTTASGPLFDYGDGPHPANGQNFANVDAYDTVNINCTTGLITGRPVYVPPPPPLGPQVPPNFVLHQVSCTSKLYWSADPKATVNTGDQVVVGQTFYVSPTAVKGTDGKQWTPIFVGSFDLVYVPTDCVFPNQVVVNAAPPPSKGTGGYAPTFGFNR